MCDRCHALRDARDLRRGLTDARSLSNSERWAGGAACPSIQFSKCDLAQLGLLAYQSLPSGDDWLGQSLGYAVVSRILHRTEPTTMRAVVAAMRGRASLRRLTLPPTRGLQGSAIEHFDCAAYRVEGRSSSSGASSCAAEARFRWGSRSPRSGSAAARPLSAVVLA